MINSLPKFWPFLANEPNAKVLVASKFDNLPGFITEILGRMGLDKSRIVSFDQPTRLKRLIVPTPAVLEQYWIYTIYRDVCMKVSKGIWAPWEIDSQATPVYLSKRRLTSGVGKYEDEDKIEEVMQYAGIDIVYPEQLSFAEQVKLFATRKLIIGPTGSAFHTALFAPPGRHTICYNPALEVNANFILIDKVCHNDASYFVQPGMTYKQTDDFMTVVKSPDPYRLATSLVELAKSKLIW